MKKKDFIKLFAEKAGVTLKDSERLMDCLVDCLEEVMLSGDEVAFKGFGKFYVKERQSRKGINPATKEMVEYPAKKVGKFAQSKTLDAKLNK